MKKYFLSPVILSIIAIYLIGCCTTHHVEYTQKVYMPVYKILSEVRNSIKAESPRNLKNPGKIYVYGTYLLINEKGEGIHIIDNSNPKAPNKISFLKIPGNGDIAVKNNILYADSYIDLVAFDISNPQSPALVKRLEGIFPNPLDLDGQYIDSEKGLLVEWVVKDTLIKYTYTDCGDNNVSPVNYGNERGGMLDGAPNGGKTTTSSGSGGNQTGIGGSMARFTIYQNYLYSVDRTSLQLFDISTESNPKAWAKINIGWNIETIWPYKDKLFIGSTTGMFIYDNSNPWNPTQLCQFTHARSCDPVVANDKYAYITLHSGTTCGGNQNELHIVDITSITHPNLISSYPMQGPLGLGVDGNTLFICDGAAGLKVFDVKDPKNMGLLNWQSDIKTYDVIPLGSLLIMIGDDGLYQYDYTDPKNLQLLSKIAVVK
jgi:hypothetical protein